MRGVARRCEVLRGTERATLRRVAVRLPHLRRQRWRLAFRAARRQAVFHGRVENALERSVAPSCAARRPCSIYLNVPKFGVFQAPVAPLKARFRIDPLNGHNG